MVVPVSADRLGKAWTRLTKDAVTLCLAHHDVHAAAAGESTSSSSSSQVAAEAVATDTSCRPCHTGTAGQVRVGVKAQTHPVQLEQVRVEHIVPGTTLSSAYDAAAPKHLPAGQDTVVVQVPPNAPRGLYIGRIQDVGGAVGSPFLIYVDGL